MKCEINLTDGFPSGHDAKAEWRATNIHGAPFMLCGKCVEIYKAKNPGWEKRGVTLTRVEYIAHPHAPVFSPR